ncbi:MAG: transposase [Desulfovibrio sp.]|nr:transposase [Desulfovibrio sp.]
MNYRKKVCAENARDSAKRHLRKQASDYGFTIEIMEVMPDHVHLLVDYRPEFVIHRQDPYGIYSEMVTSGISASEKGALRRTPVEPVVWHSHRK